jgi:energy-coupling factor transport system permease protein
MSQIVLFSALPGGRLVLSVGGVLTGINFIGRLLVMVLASSMLTLTTPMDDFVLFLNQLRVPSEITFMITTALRFIPTLDKKRLLILEAQRARGAKINERGSLGRIMAYIPIMVPLFVNSILIAEDLAKGMLNRGYGFARTMTHMRELHFSIRDYYMISILLFIIGGGFYLRFGLSLGIL